MDKETAEKRIKKLEAEIEFLREEYHTKDNSSDEIYDSLTRELKALLKEYPEFINLNSPINRVAGKPLSKFVKVQHKIRMLSLNDVFSFEELIDWENRVKKLLPNKKIFNYFCEIKFDGLAVSLIYEKGILKTGATRGDGFVGEDITENLKMINSIPIVLNNKNGFVPEYLEVRGEALMSKKTFISLNNKNESEGKTLFANTRNAAAGSLRQLDPKLAKARNLDFYAYDIAQVSYKEENSLLKSTDIRLIANISPRSSRAAQGFSKENFLLKTHSQKHKLLKDLGFNVGEFEKECSSREEVKEFISYFSKLREKFPFGTDGIVVSIDELDLQEVLGVVGKAPRYMVAFKYPAERATTIVLDIKVNIGRTGVLTPLAVFKPTQVAGSLVSKATLHNMDQIKRLDIRIGDTVVIEKAGDVIPKVTEVLKRLRSGKEKEFKMLKNCYICGGKIAKKINQVSKEYSLKSTDIRLVANSSARSSRTAQGFSKNNSLLTENSVAYYCSNPKCPAKNERYLEHFVKVFDIYELGPKILRRFKDEGLITDAADIFTLKKEDIAPLERFGEKSADNIIKEIEEKKKVNFSKFIFALGILHVGEETARDLALHFENISNLKNARVEEIEGIENIGPKVAKSLYEFFRDKKNLYFIDKLFKNGVIIKKEEKKKDGKLKGKIFVLTGTLKSMSREIAKEKILKKGGKVASSVSSNTSYLVSGEEAGSKLTKAQKLGIKILNEKDFLEIIT